MDITNLTANDTFNPDDTFRLRFDPVQIVQAITALASLAANALVVVTVVRRPSMRTRPNLYLANWCSCNLIVMAIVPLALNLFGVVDEISFECICLYEETLYAVLFGNFLFVVALLLDWYTSTYCARSCANRVANVHLYVIAGVWLVVTSVTVASVTLCALGYSYPLSVLSYLVSFLVIFVIVLVVLVLRCVQTTVFKSTREKSRVELVVVTSFFVCWLFNWVHQYAAFLGLYLSARFENFGVFMGYSHAWIMAALLYWCDARFRVCWRGWFGCSGRRGEEGEEAVRKEQIAVLL